MNSAYAMVLAFTVLLILGTPIAFAMSLAAVIAIGLFDPAPLVLLPQLFFTSTNNFSLLAIPLFIFAGALMAKGGITDLLVGFSRAMLGHFKGGLAQANILSNTCMAAVSGSATADVAAVGSIMIPAMSRSGYPPTFAVSVTSCAAMLATIIPPSVVAIIYATITGVSVGQLFLAGAIPGVVSALGMMILARFYASRFNMPSDPKASWTERLRSFSQAVPALMMPVIIVGGILGGIFTATEAGAVACAYALAYTLYKGKAQPGALYETVLEAAVTTGAALIVVGGCALFSWELVRSGATEAITSSIMTFSDDPRIVAALIIGFLLLLGTVMEPVPALILSGPLIVTAVSTFGLDPLSFGVACLMVLILGAVTPPVGILAMVACRIARIPYASTFRPIMPFILLWLGLIILIMYVPIISNFLPSLTG
ncbi:MAG: TRAP transporter large permease [Pusillimonas sp.]